MIVEEESNEGKEGDVKVQEELEGVILEDSRTWVEGEDEEDDGVDDLVWFDLLEELGLGTLGHKREGAAGRFPQREETSSPGESGNAFTSVSTCCTLMLI
jgi:hypothetical protein